MALGLPLLKAIPGDTVNEIFRTFVKISIQIIMESRTGIFIICLLFCFAWTSCNTGKSKQKNAKDTIPEIKPALEYKLTAEVFPSTVDNLTGILYNNTEFPAIYGTMYDLEYSTGTSWEKVIVETDDDVVLIFPSIGYALSPHGQSNTNSFTWQQYHDYQPGRYRISKGVSLDVETSLYITDTNVSKDSGWVKNIKSEYLNITICPKQITTQTDSIEIEITNHSSMEMTFERFNLNPIRERMEIFLYQVDSIPIQPKESRKYKIALKPDPRFYPSKKEYSLSPGEYHLKIDLEITLSYEFKLFYSKKKKRNSKTTLPNSSFVITD